MLQRGKCVFVCVCVGGGGVDKNENFCGKFPTIINSSDRTLYYMRFGSNIPDN